MSTEELKAELYLRLHHAGADGMSDIDVELLFHLAQDPAIQNRLQDRLQFEAVLEAGLKTQGVGRSHGQDEY